MAITDFNIGDKIIAVVVTYNRPRELSNAISALLNQTSPPDHILVVDNASSPAAISSLPCSSNITVIRSEVNTGGAGGFSLGLEWAKGTSADWVWLMDDDACPRPDALEVLRLNIRNTPKNIGVICSAVYEFGSISRVHRRFFNKDIGLEVAIPAQFYNERMCDIDTGSFVGFLVRMEAVKNSGLPDADFFIAYDDTEYSLRLKLNGWKLQLAPMSKIDHMITHRSLLKSSEFSNKHYYNIRNRIVVLRRYANFKVLAGVYATLYGLLIWVRSPASLNLTAIALFSKSIKDGWLNRLGKIN